MKYDSSLIHSTDAADPPSHTIEGGNMYVGSDVTMTCSLGRDGNPAVGNYTWYHDSRLDGQVTATNSRSVRLNNITQDGNYSCEAFNIPYTGEWLGSGRSQETELFVRGKSSQRLDH